MAAITNMTNGARPDYQLGQNLGDTSWGSRIYTATNSAPQMIDVYGIIPAFQPGVSAIGVHTGSAIITVTFWLPIITKAWDEKVAFLCRRILFQ
jgi:hypothetical protein